MTPHKLLSLLMMIPTVTIPSLDITLGMEEAIEDTAPRSIMESYATKPSGSIDPLVLLKEGF